MAIDVTSEDGGLTYGYKAPVQTTSNLDTATVQALLAQLKAAGVQIPEQVVELTPEEAARKAIDSRGAGLGTEERLQELYRHLDTIARKVGI